MKKLFYLLLTSFLAINSLLLVISCSKDDNDILGGEDHTEKVDSNKVESKMIKKTLATMDLKMKKRQNSTKATFITECHLTVMRMIICIYIHHLQNHFSTMLSMNTNMTPKNTG